jgi:hypothetical protein
MNAHRLSRVVFDPYHDGGLCRRAGRSRGRYGGRRGQAVDNVQENFCQVENA